MATLRLDVGDLHEDRLPELCMRCGQPSALVRRKTFTWGPEWVMTLLVIGAACSGPLFLLTLLLIPICLRRMTVPVPLCERHRNPWLPLQIVLYGGLGFVALMATAAIALWATGLTNEDAWKQIAASLGFASVALFVLMLFPAAILQTRVIRPVKITNWGITLTNVSRTFADEFDDMKDEFEDMEEERSRARRRARRKREADEGDPYDAPDADGD